MGDSIPGGIVAAASKSLLQKLCNFQDSLQERKELLIHLCCVFLCAREPSAGDERVGRCGGV